MTGAQKINLKMVRKAAAQRGIFTVSALAASFGCSREAIYFALERPTRYPNVFDKIRRLVSNGEALHA